MVEHCLKNLMKDEYSFRIHPLNTDSQKDGCMMHDIFYEGV